MSRPRAEAGQIEGAPEIEETTLTPAEDALLRDALWDACLASAAISRTALERGEEQLADAALRRASALRALLRKLDAPPPH